MIVYCVWTEDDILKTLDRATAERWSVEHKSDIIPVVVDGVMDDDCYCLVGESDSIDKRDTLEDAIVLACELTDWDGDVPVVPPVLIRSKKQDDQDMQEVAWDLACDAFQARIKELEEVNAKLSKENRELKKELNDKKNPFAFGPIGEDVSPWWIDEYPLLAEWPELVEDEPDDMPF